MILIPAIDLLHGQAVRLTQGDYLRATVYDADPLEVAKRFEGAGIMHLHLVDLDGARSKRIVNHAVLERIAANTNLTIDFGGGLKRDEDVRIAFESGAHQITGGSVAALQPELFLSWLVEFGPDKIILGADAKDRRIAVNGWQQATDADVSEYIADYHQKGVTRVICTDIRQDGTLKGPSLDLYREIMDRTPVELIASGGVSSIEDLHQLRDLGCPGAIVGKALYENRISLQELTEFNQTTNS